MADDGWWDEVGRTDLCQGDLFRDLEIPVFIEQDAPPEVAPTGEKILTADVLHHDVVLLTQSCDLENTKVKSLIVCPVFSLLEFQQLRSEYAGKSKREEIRKGKHIGVHLLAAIDSPANWDGALVVNFREIYSIPRWMLNPHLTQKRYRLRSPYVEHMSQTFAQVFMRVALPVQIGDPPMKGKA